MDIRCLMVGMPREGHKETVQVVVKTKHITHLMYWKDLAHMTGVFLGKWNFKKYNIRTVIGK